MRGVRAIGAVVAILTVVGCRDDAGDTGATTATTASGVGRGEVVAASEVVVGDCLSGVAVGVNERTQIESARAVSCQGPHELEVFASFELRPGEFETDPPGAYPGEQRVVGAADTGCASRLAALADKSAFGLIALWPTATSWRQGDRTVACLAFPADRDRFEGPDLLADG